MEAQAEQQPEAGQPSVPRKKMTKQLTGKRDDTLLHTAAREGNLPTVIEILGGTGEAELKELLAKQNQAGETALYVAAEYGYVDLVREMIKCYDLAEAGIKARNGFDALHIAAKQGDMEVLKVLMEAHPELSMTVDVSNTTALHTAATQGHIEVVNFLLEAGSGLATIARSNGKTALHSAARNGHLEVLKALLEKEPEITKRTDRKGQTALHMAVKGQSSEVVEQLIMADPSSVNMVDNKCNTPLHIATRKGRAQDQLRHEMVAEINKLGRVSLIDIADSTGVDLYHIEKQAQHVLANDPGLMLIQGEIISQTYWDSVAEEINERLQECSQIALAELAAQLHVGSELVTSVLEPRLGTMVKGRLEGGQLYTPAYVARVSAMVRGSARGITVPTNLSVVWSSLQQLLHEMDGASGVAIEVSFFQSLFNGILKEGEVLGSLRAGVHWTPNVFAIAQKACVDSFFSQNSFISYETLQKLGISQPVQFLQSRYPEGIPLVTAFVHPSMIEMLDAATEDALERSSWIDSLSVLPASFGSQDAYKILSLCPSIQLALKSNKVLIFGESYVFSNGFIKDVYDRMEKEIESFSVSGSSGVMLSESHLVNVAKVGHDSSRLTESNDAGSETASNKQAIEKGQKKKKGKSAGNVISGAAESGSDNQEHVPTKSKKNQRKGKDTSSLPVSESKIGAKKESVKKREDNLSIPSEEWLAQKIMTLVPDFEEQGIDDTQTVLRPLANHLRPMLINSWKERRKTLFTENVERMKRLLDNLQRKLDESFLNIQLYEKALDLFEDDQSTSVILHRHLLRTVAAPIVDTLLHNLDIHNKLRNGIEVEEAQNSESVSLSPGERTALAKSFPGSLLNKALAVVDALEGKRVETFLDAFRALSEESGLLLKKLDKKLERTLLHSYRKDLTSQVSAETDPISLLAKVVSLLYVQVHHKALQAPGRAISVAVSRLKDKLDDSACKILADYQTATVTLLALMSAATGDEEDCSSDRILTKRELLENQMPALKGLVLSASQS